ncbi:putative LPS assembly protein LptD [Fulvivirgaceae bacterium LMO-SS25]
MLRYKNGFFLLLLFFGSWVGAQERVLETENLPPIPFRDSLELSIPPNLLDTIPPDSLLITRQRIVRDTIGDVKTTIIYNAEDSIRLDVIKNIAYLYGNAEIKYGPIELKADYIELDWANNILYATGIPDTTGKLQGKPIFKEGIETYETTTLRYNFTTGKAYITGAVTQQGEGFLQAESIKKTQSGELFTYYGRYTTCNLEHPHFHIQSEMIKAIPGNKLVSGPFHLRFNDIPTPLGFAFGMFPDQKKKRSSGIIFPTYGEERVRGFFIRDGGYYLALNDIIHLSVMGEVYSKGGYGATLQSTYNKRYSYQGSFRFNYSRFNSDETELNPIAINDFWVDWSHRPVPKGSSRFSASVRAGTSTYNNNNTLNFERNVNSEFSSSVQYQKNFTGTPFNMSANARHSQNVRDGRVQVTLPEAAFNMNRITPFKDSEIDFVNSLNFAWNFNLTSNISNRPSGRVPSGITLSNPSDIPTDSIMPFNFETLPYLLRNARIGGRHQIPVSTTFNVLKHINVSPSFNYEELWYLQELRYTWQADQKAVRLDTIPGFKRAGTYNASIGAATRIYGTYNLKKGNIQAIRHMVTPSVGFSYRPDYSDKKYGYFQEVQVNEKGDTRLLSKYEGFAYGAPSIGESASLNFSLENNLEAKKVAKGDSATKAEKVKLIDNFGISTSYNFLADSFGLSNIRTALRTNLFQGLLNVNIGAEIDPYLTQLDSISDTGQVFQRRLDKFAWNNGQGIGRIRNVTLNLSTNLNPAAKGTQGGASSTGLNRMSPTGMMGDGVSDTGLAGAQNLADSGDLEAMMIMSSPYNYVDFTIPWNVNISYNLNYRRDGFRESDVTQALTFNGDVSITEKWKISFNSGYDLATKELTHTTISINRDLHCWELRVNWVPFGRFTSYSVDLQVKSSLLQDLKINRRRNLNDR